MLLQAEERISIIYTAAVELLVRSGIDLPLRTRQL